MQDTITKCLGLVSQYNPLSTQPGALTQADDCVIRRENTVENRRGYSVYGSLTTSGTQILTYLKKVLVHNGTRISFDNGSGTFSNYAYPTYTSSYNAPSGSKMRSVEAKGNCYFTSDQGVQVLMDTAGTAARMAGAPRSLDPSASLLPTNSGFLVAGYQCAYRCVIQRTDANQNVLFGYPSTRVVVTNAQYTPTATLTNGSSTLSSVSSTAGIQAGMTATGTGIPLGSTVLSTTGSSVVISNNVVIPTYTVSASATNGGNQLTNVSSTAGLAIGMIASGTGIPAGTTIVAINSVTSSGATTTDITLSANFTGTTGTVSASFALPSTSVTVTFGQAANTSIVVYLPAEILSSDVIQIYRTAQYASNGTDAAGDEMALVYQTSPTPTDISNGSITFSDSIGDALRGASLYTSPSQQGIQQANQRPPQCKDLALFRSNYMFYANTATPERLYLTLVGTSSLTGNTVTLAGATYSFASSENSAIGQVAVSATGIAAFDIDATARSLVRVINRYSSNTRVYAYYLSGPTDLPGQILLQERGVGAAAFTVQASNTSISAMFYPPPPVSPATNTQSTSSNSVQKNAIFYSKFQEPEHVPILNYILVGPANTEIQRVVALRDSLIIIKEEGVYALRGDTPQSFTVVPLDLTVFCKATDSVCVLANQCFFLSNQGVVAVSDTGVQVVSREIEPNIMPLISYSNLAANTYGHAYESERSYFLSIISTSTDTIPTQIYVYNIFTRTWTRWSFGWAAAIVEPSTDRLYFVKNSDTSVFAERKSFTINDYADPDYPITILSVSGNQITFSVTGVTPRSDWAIQQGTTSILITAVAPSGSNFIATLSITAPLSWTTGAGKLFPAVSMALKWDVWSAGQPGFMKHVRQFEILTDSLSGNNQTTGISATFSTDLDGVQDSVPINTAAYRWGNSPWGEFPWGGRSDTFAYRTYVPRNKQYCRIMNAGLQHGRAFERCSVSGCSYTFDQISERVNR